MMFDGSFGSRTHRCYRVSGMTLYPWILLHATLVVLDGQQCFEDAVAAGQRRNLSDTESDESFPFAMWVPTWASGTLTSAVVGILVEAWVPGQTKFVVGLTFNHRFCCLRARRSLDTIFTHPEVREHRTNTMPWPAVTPLTISPVADVVMAQRRIRSMRALVKFFSSFSEDFGN